MTNDLYPCKYLNVGYLKIDDVQARQCAPVPNVHFPTLILKALSFDWLYIKQYSIDLTIIYTRVGHYISSLRWATLHVVK